MANSYINHLDEYNEKLNDICAFLYKNYPIIINNIHTLSSFDNKILNGFSNKDLSEYFIENGLTINEVIDLSREIIENINPEYLDSFNEMVQDGRLEFIYTDDDSFNDNMKTSFLYYPKTKTKTINIVREKNYTDVVNLVHEFFHYLNYDLNNKNRSNLTEFFSIYFEQYAIDYLINKKNINPIEIDSNYRISNFLYTCNYLSYFSIPLITYHYFGDIDNDSFDYLIRSKKAKLDKKTYDYYMDEFYNIIKNEKPLQSENDMEFFVGLSYKYMINTSSALYARKNLKKDDIVKMYESIKNYKNVDNIDFYDILLSNNINIFSTKFIYDTIEEMNSLYCRNKKGEKKCLKLES